MNFEFGYNTDAMFYVRRREGFDQQTTEKLIDSKELRDACRCAICVDESTGQRNKSKPVPDESNSIPRNIKTVGNYGYQVDWSDGHVSIFTKKVLSEM